VAWGDTVANIGETFATVVGKEGIKVMMIDAAHLDDGLLTGSKSECERALDKLSKIFILNVDRNPKRYIGIDITRFRKSKQIFLNQMDYINNFVDEHKVELAEVYSNYSTPMDTNFKHTFDEGEPIMTNPKKYARIIGQLMYATLTRVDCVYAVNTLAKYISNPQAKHYKASLRVIQFMGNTKTMSLKLQKDLNKPYLEIYSDASYAMDTRSLSRTGGAVYYFGSLIGTMSKSQKTVALSSGEAEYIALVDIGKFGLYVRQLLLDIHSITECGTITIHTDNLAALEIATNAKYRGRSKHFEVRYHKIREWINRGIYTLKYCQTNDMIADILTKALPRLPTRKLRQLMQLVEMQELEGGDAIKDIKGMIAVKGINLTREMIGRDLKS